MISRSYDLTGITKTNEEKQKELHMRDYSLQDKQNQAT